MPKYYVLGKAASVFWDPTTRLKVVSHTEPTESKKLSKRMELAIKQGHIVEVPSGASVETVPPTKAKSGKKLSKNMTDEELTAFYEENFIIEEGDMEAFEKLDTAGKYKFLKQP